MINSPIIGITVDNIPVMGGLFQLHDEKGCALTTSVGLCIERSYAPGFGEFTLQALHAGWTRNQITKTVLGAMRDNEMRIGIPLVQETLNKIFAHR